MDEKLRELHEAYRKAISQARQITDKADEEKRNLTSEESVNFDRYMDDAEQHRSAIERRQTLLAAERRQAELADASNANRRITNDDDEEEEDRTVDAESIERRKFELFFRAASDDRADRQAALEEARRLQADSDILGGYTEAPAGFVRELLKAVDDQLFIGNLARTFDVNGRGSLGVPTLDTDPDDADWTAEIGTVAQDASMAFGKRELEPHDLTKKLLVSRKLLRSSALPIESIIRDRLAYKLNRPAENAYLNGTGASQPLGVFVASTDGISTSRDVSTGNTTTDIGVDGLIEAKYALKPQYLSEARWLFHRDAVKRLAKKKDTTDQYLWQPSVRAGAPETILGLPIDQSELVPNTFTTGLYVGALAVWRFYWIVRSMDLMIQRLDELHSATRQVGFQIEAALDGMPVLEEAFVRVTLA